MVVLLLVVYVTALLYCRCRCSSTVSSSICRLYTSFSIIAVMVLEFVYSALIAVQISCYCALDYSTVVNTPKISFPLEVVILTLDVIVRTIQLVWSDLLKRWTLCWRSHCAPSWWRSLVWRCMTVYSKIRRTRRRPQRPSARYVYSIELYCSRLVDVIVVKQDYCYY